MNKLKEIRINHNITMQEMAVKLKISKAFYCQIENNKRTLTYQMAVNIAAIFNLKPDDIFYKATKKDLL